MVLQAIKYTRGSLSILDQLQLPHHVTYDEIHTSKDAWEAIHSMRVRGAPAIAIVAALGLAVELHDLPDFPQRNVKSLIYEKLEYLITSRPTAVNLAGAAAILKKAVAQAMGKEDATSSSIKEAYISTAEQMLIHDVEDNEAIGKHGAEWIMKHSPLTKNGPISILTHCNTGSLATAGYGTALGVIRTLHSAGNLKTAFCTETRPYNQGSRLTAFELVHDEIPATLVTDSMASALLRLKGESFNITAVVVGADRVARNGDTANKIGTYNLAITARYHGVKFLVAAPRTTIDVATATGEDIRIEERPGKELTSIRGPRLDRNGRVDMESEAVTISVAAKGVGVWNPAFDITPAELIDGIVTEVGVMVKDKGGSFRLEEIMEEGQRQTNGMANSGSKDGMFPDKPF